jgi:sugar/nucleoside kinase (ribokinase family)
MKTTRRGVMAGGNWVMDQTKIIDRFPHQDGLANVLKESRGNGGSPYNILKDLSKLGVDFPLYGVGLVGNDSNGNFILEDCRQHGIDISAVEAVDEKATSYTDVMTVKETGRRTFFHQRGANSLLSRAQFNLKDSKAKILHLGYLLLLDELDRLDEENRTQASYLLEDALHLGFKTSLDVVSENSERFRKIVPPALPFTHFLFLNEYEAGKITGLDLRVKTSPNLERFKEAAELLLAMGVKEWVIIHCAQGALAYHKSGKCHVQGSLKVPEKDIAGTSGAGDAFAAGVLWGLHDEKPMEECPSCRGVYCGFLLKVAGAL